MKLDEGVRSVKAGVEDKFVHDKAVLEATEKQHSALVESKALQSHRRRDLEAEAESSTKINKEQEERAGVKNKAVLQRESDAKANVVEVNANKNLLEGLVIKAAAVKDGGQRKLSNVKEEKKQAKERLSQVEECVDQLRQAASSRQIETGVLIQQVGDLEAIKP